MIAPESGRSRSHEGKDADVNLLQQAGLNIGYLAMNVTEAALRQEGSAPGDHHGDRPGDAILKEVYQGAGQKAKNPIPPTIWSYDDAIRITSTIRTRPRRC